MSGKFVYPYYTSGSSGGRYGGALVWNVGSNQTLVWNTTLSTYDIWLYHQLLETPEGSGVQAGLYPVASFEGDGAGPQTYTWTVSTLDSDISASPVFFFWLDPGPDGISSSYFNITEEDSSPISSSISTISTSTSTSASSSSSSTSMPTFTSSTTSTSMSISMVTTTTMSSSGLNNTAAATSSPLTGVADATTPSSALPIGLGVGLGIGIPLILAIGIWLGMMVMRQRRRSSLDHSQPPTYVNGKMQQMPEPSYYPAVASSEQKQRVPPKPATYESPGNPLHEAPGENCRDPVEIG